MSPWKQDPNKKIRSAAFPATVSVVAYGVLTAGVLLAFSTYSHAPEKARFVLWVPSMFIHSKLVTCPEDSSLVPQDCPSELEPNFVLLFGSFILLYFILGAGIAAAVIALRRQFRKEST